MKGAKWFSRGWALWPALLAGTWLRFWGLSQVALIGDEAYYWLWSRRLALSYVDHPSGVAWLIRLSTLVAGPSEVGVRWLNALLGVVSVALVYAVGRRLFTPLAGVLAAWLMALGAPFLVGARFVYTDGLLLALILAHLALLVPMVFPRERAPVATWRFVVVGVLTAALFNTKYGAYLYVLAILAFLLWHRWALLAERRAWWAMGLATCGLLPTLLWNAAHGWISFRWQFDHFFAAGALGGGGPLGNVVHAVRYLTPPLVLAALAGLASLRGARRQMLLLPALVLLLPVLLSPANSPRNLVVGLALLLPLAGEAAGRWLAHLRGPARSVAWAAMAGVVVLVGVYGVGTVWATWRPLPLPRSSVSDGIRRETAGWRKAASLPLRPEQPLFAIDYHVAGLLRYYAGIPAETAWPQYALWGPGEVCDAERVGGGTDSAVQIVALPYVDPALVSSRLASAFRQVEGPVVLSLGEAEGQRLRLWTARDCTIPREVFLEQLDLFSLVQGGAR